MRDELDPGAQAMQLAVKQALDPLGPVQPRQGGGTTVTPGPGVLREDRDPDG